MAHTTRADLVNQVRQYLAKAVTDRSNGPSAPELAAWEDFFTTYNEILRRFVLSLGWEDIEFDDLMQDVWLDVIRLLPSFDYDPAKGGFRRWLYRIVRSKAIDQIRRHRARSANLPSATPTTDLWVQISDPASIDPADGLERKLEEQLVHWAIEQLRNQATTQEFEIFQLCQIQGQARQQAAVQLGLSAEATRACLYRVRTRFRSILASVIGQEEIKGAGK